MGPNWKLTIVTTTRNNAQDLIATVKSIKEQRNREFEWLIYDGSDDADAQLRIEQMASAMAADLGEGRVRMVHRFDSGIYEAMNNAVSLCRGEFVIFLNCGDMLADERTVGMIQSFLTDSVDVLHGDEIYVDSKGAVTFKNGMPAKDLWEGFSRNSHPYLDHMVCQQAIIYRCSTLKDNPLSATFRVSADHDHFFGLFRKGYKFSYINKPLCIYFAGGFSFRHPANCYFDWIQVQAKYAEAATHGKSGNTLKPFSNVFHATLELTLFHREEKKRRQCLAMVMQVIEVYGRLDDRAGALDRISKLLMEYCWELMELEFWTLAAFYSELINRVAPREVVSAADVHLAVLHLLHRIQTRDEAKLTAYELKLIQRLVTGAARFINAIPRMTVSSYKHLDAGNLDGGVSSVLSREQYKKVRSQVEAKGV